MVSLMKQDPELKTDFGVCVFIANNQFGLVCFVCQKITTLQNHNFNNKQSQSKKFYQQLNLVLFEFSFVDRPFTGQKGKKPSHKRDLLMNILVFIYSFASKMTIYFQPQAKYEITSLLLDLISTFVNQKLIGC